MPISFITLPAALLATVISVLAAIFAGLQRSSHIHEQLLIGGIFALIALAVHLLPSLRNVHVLPRYAVWMLCLIVAAISHKNFIDIAAHSAAQARAEGEVQGGPAALLLQQRRAALEAVLGSSQARSAALVASLLAREREESRRVPLKIELREAERNNQYRKELADLSEKQLKTLDSVIDREKVTSDILSACAAALMELLGALLWWSYTRKEAEVVTAREDQTKPVVSPPSENSPKVSALGVHSTDGDFEAAGTIVTQKAQKPSTPVAPASMKPPSDPLKGATPPPIQKKMGIQTVGHEPVSRSKY